MQEEAKTYGEGFSSGFARFQHTQEFWDVSVPQQYPWHMPWIQYCRSRHFWRLHSQSNAVQPTHTLRGWH